MFAIVGDITSKLCQNISRQFAIIIFIKKKQKENEELNEVSQVIVACGQQFLLVQIKKEGCFPSLFYSELNLLTLDSGSSFRVQ